MPNQAGSLEILAREIAHILEPLEQRLENGGVLQLFTDLGLRFPPALLSVTGVEPALQSIATAAGELPDLVVELTDAIEAEDELAMIAAGASVIACGS